ncbi:hypothetical protein [Actinomadura opuntiae]|uniref:hypothetical protein n=1 Tax=Actinomadura sp. OS1-43 TaxID=604315 RepID=UPI00255AFDEE|nr:hypothetical protein [Actinomadura sp. OS1-43]MDL4818650.1 hypothetical protein [Actinomadura sp. OS1-43]
MTSVKRYQAESLLREAERDFEVARASVKAAAASYERCRDRAPGSGWVANAQRSWFLGVSDWIHKALVLEEALAAVMLLDRESDTGVLPAVPSSPERVDLAAVDALSGRDGKDRLRAPNPDAPEPDPELQARLKRTGDNFTAAADTVKAARRIADTAFRTYRGSRTTASTDQLGQMREAWRKALVEWSFALRDREAARDKALAAMQRAGQLSTDPVPIGTVFSSNITDVDTDEDELF